MSPYIGIKKYFLFVSITLACSVTLFCCAALKDFSNTMTNLARLKFKLDSVSGFQLAGIPLSGKTTLSVMDGARILSAFSRNELPATFVLNVGALNPNDGTGGTTKTSSTLTSLSWTLIVDNTLTIKGDIADPITIPGTGQEVLIPLQMNLDLVKFFKDKGYESIVNLALAIGGASGSPSRLTLRVKPTVQTPYGPLTYPNEIDVIDREFR